MATLKEATKALLTGSSEWTTLVAGGTYDRTQDFPREGFTPDDATYDSGGKIKLTAVLAWSTDSPREIVSNSEQRFFQLFLYHDNSQASIEQAKTLAKKLLHQKRVSFGTSQSGSIFYVDGSREYQDESLGGCEAQFVRFHVMYTRR